VCRGDAIVIAALAFAFAASDSCLLIHRLRKWPVGRAFVAPVADCETACLVEERDALEESAALMVSRYRQWQEEKLAAARARRCITMHVSDARNQKIDVPVVNIPCKPFQCS
jgi:hypothetical protein